MTDIGERLDRVRRDGPQRQLRLVSGPRGPRAVVEGRPCLLLGSDNYLGIADHPRVREAAAEAASRWGGGAGAPRTSSGSMGPHRQLERRLAGFVGYEAALVQGPAQMTVAATVAALARPGEVVFSDELNHPGIAAGCRLSGAEVFVYDHGDTEHLAWGLERARGAASLLVSESVFGAEGDLAPVEALAELAADHRCRLLVEESHAIGAVGPEGRGLVAATGLAGEVDVVVATLGKALGSYGSFVACDAAIAEYLAGSSASMHGSTALPPAATAAATAALELLCESPYRVERLRLNAESLRRALADEGVRTGPSQSQIVTVPASGPEALAEACERAVAQGVLPGTVEPPELPGGEAALRLTAMATHRASELRAAAAVVSSASRGAGIAAAEPLRAVEQDWIAGEGWLELPAREPAADPAAIDVPDWIRAA